MKTTLSVIIVSLLLITGTCVLASEKGPKNNPSKQCAISGVILDTDSNEKLAGVTVSFADSDKKIYTDSNGGFTLEGLAPGTYKLKINCISYKDKEISVKVNATREEKLTVQLKPIEP
jgi:hypothetical protein